MLQERTNMAKARMYLEPGKKGRGQLSVKETICEAVLQIMLQRVRESGYGLAVAEDLREHFSKLPASYALTVDPSRHDDVILHMKLLSEAREAERRGRSLLEDLLVLPIVHVRRVSLNCSPSESESDGHGSRTQAIPIPFHHLPKPAFGSNLNLASLGSASPSSNILRMYPRSGTSMSPTAGSRGTSPAFMRVSSPGGRFTPPGRMPHGRSRSGASISLSEMDEDSSGGGSPRVGYGVGIGWEITVATSDRQGLLKYLTAALSGPSTDLNIREAHAFSTTDGMALEVFVVEGWPLDDAEELRQAVLRSVRLKLSDCRMESPHLTEKQKLEVLRGQVEAIAYEDWAVDFSDLTLGEKLGRGSSGKLYRSFYRGQEVAVKVMMLSSADEDESMSGSIRAQSACELLHLFKQEVSVMRVVRHKNVVQFIGACSSWPRLFIVTELMSGGSIRDMLQNSGCGLETMTAIKVLRDACRGLDFLHRRGIIHRDVKAANLLIDEHKVVKVCDFGVARMIPSAVKLRTGMKSEEENVSEMTAETGTYRWMAPEVLEHRPYDHKADVYSFGIMIWEILTGGIPYPGFSPLQAAIGVVQRGLRPTMPPTTHPKLAALAQSCWQQNPEDRPDFTEVLATLEDMLAPPTAWQRAIFGSRGV